MILKTNNEIIGTLRQISKENNQIKLFFNIDKEIELPVTAFSTDELKDLIGARLGIFNCDGRYKIRKIRNK